MDYHYLRKKNSSTQEILLHSLIIINQVTVIWTYVNNVVNKTCYYAMGGFSKISMIKKDYSVK